MPGLDTILLVAALICFALATVGVTLGTVNLVALGLALWVLSLLIP